MKAHDPWDLAQFADRSPSRHFRVRFTPNERCASSAGSTVANPVPLLIDRVKATVYTVTGAMNVPGHSKHVYQVIVPGANAAGFGPVTGGSIAVPGTSTAVPGGWTSTTAALKWDAGEVVGTYKVNVPMRFSIIRQVNVVKVEFDATEGNQIVLIGFRNTQWSNKLGVESSDNWGIQPAMYASIRTSYVAGPTVNGGRRGQRFIDMGFVQTMTFVHMHGDYNDTNPKFRVGPLTRPDASSEYAKLEGKSYIDVAPDALSGSPWSHKDYRDVYGDHNYKALRDDQNFPEAFFDTKDSPSVPAVEMLTVAGDQVDFFSIVLSFDNYFAVHTKETVNGANDSYTVRASFHWDWNASGPINNNGFWSSSFPVEQIVTTTANPKKYAESTAGNIVLPSLTKGIIAGNAVKAENMKWEKANQ